MSRFILGNCIDVMRGFPDRAVDLIVTDPPYLVGFKDRQGRQIAGDVTDEWLQPATLEMYRVLKKDALMVSFYSWNRVDRFMAAWKAAGFYAVGQLVFTKNYASNRRNARARRGFVDYCHEGAYVLAKGRPGRDCSRPVCRKRFDLRRCIPCRTPLYRHRNAGAVPPGRNRTTGRHAPGRKYPGGER